MNNLKPLTGVWRRSGRSSAFRSVFYFFTVSRSLILFAILFGLVKIDVVKDL